MSITQGPSSLTSLHRDASVKPTRHPQSTELASACAVARPPHCDPATCTFVMFPRKKASALQDLQCFRAHRTPGRGSCLLDLEQEFILLRALSLTCLVIFPSEAGPLGVSYSTVKCRHRMNDPQGPLNSHPPFVCSSGLLLFLGAFHFLCVLDIKKQV